VDKLNAYLVADINAPEPLHKLALNRRMENADPCALGSSILLLGAVPCQPGRPRSIITLPAILCRMRR